MEPNETAALVHRAAAGDSRAWESLVRAYAGLVWSVARAHRLGSADAEDVSQTTWERFARSLDAIKEPEHAGGWLATTARRESLRVLTARNRVTPTADLAWTGASPAAEDVALDRAEDELRAELAARVWRALNRLGDACQRLLRVLMAEPPPSYAEAAAALDMPIGSLGPTRRRCLEKLGRLADVSAAPERAHE